MDVLEIDEFLSHHGIKGQKWGFRNRKVGGHDRPKMTTERKLTIANTISGAVIGNVVGVLVSEVLKEKGTKPIVTAIGTTLASIGTGAAVKALLSVGEKKIIEMKVNRVDKKINKK